MIPSEDKPTPPGIDWHDYQRRYEQNLELGADILTAFIQDLPSQKAYIIQHHKQGDYDALQTCIHKLHGASGYACVPTLKALLYSTESILKQCIYHQLPVHMEKLIQEFDLIAKQYQEYAYADSHE